MISGTKINKISVGVPLDSFSGDDMIVYMEYPLIDDNENIKEKALNIKTVEDLHNFLKLVLRENYQPYHEAQTKSMLLTTSILCKDKDTFINLLCSGNLYEDLYMNFIENIKEEILVSSLLAKEMVENLAKTLSKEEVINYIYNPLITMAIYKNYNVNKIIELITDTLQRVDSRLGIIEDNSIKHLELLILENGYYLNYLINKIHEVNIQKSVKHIISSFGYPYVYRYVHEYVPRLIKFMKRIKSVVPEYKLIILMEQLGYVKDVLEDESKFKIDIPKDKQSTISSIFEYYEDESQGFIKIHELSNISKIIKDNIKESDRKRILYELYDVCSKYYEFNGIAYHSILYSEKDAKEDFIIEALINDNDLAILYDEYNMLDKYAEIKAEAVSKEL